MSRWSNWSRETTYDGLRIYEPHSLDQLQNAVRDAAVVRGLQVRTVGAGHSWTNIGLPREERALIVTEHLDRVLEIDRDTMTVTVEGGARLHDLNDELFDEGLSLPTMGDTDRQSLAGAIATDTHGSGPRLRSLSEFVEGIRLVKADGSVIDVAEDDLPAARVSLGALGAVYSVKMRVVDAIFLDHIRTTVPFRDEVDHLDDHLASWRHVEYWYFPYTGHADLIRRKTRSPVPPRTYPFRTAQMRREALLADAVGRLRPSALPWLLRQGVEFRMDDPDEREGPAHTILPLVAQSTVDLIKTHTMEYLLPLERLWEGFDALVASLEAARARDVYVSLPIHIRFVRQSERSLLSPCTDPVSASFSINYSRSHEGFHIWFRDFEERMLDLGGRTHLGKICFQPPRIPDEFHEVRRRLDPDERFWNPQSVYPETP